MKNKYQEALKNIASHLSNSGNGKYIKNGEAIDDLNTLQELIDDYERLSDAIIRAIDYRIARDKRDECYIDTEENGKSGY